MRYEPYYNEEMGHCVRDKQDGIIYTTTELCNLLYDKDLVIRKFTKEDNRRYRKVDTIFGKKDNIYDNGRVMEYPNSVVEKLNSQDEMIGRLTDAFVDCMRMNNDGNTIYKVDLMKAMYLLKKRNYWIGEYMSRAEAERHREVHRFIKQLCDMLDIDYKELDLDEKALQDL